MYKHTLFQYLLIIILAVSNSVHAQKYPADAGIIDVSQAPYNADKTGDVDATAAINKALDDYPNGSAIIYLPQGTYLISNTLKWPGYDRGSYGSEVLEGDGIDKTIIKLKDNCTGFTTISTPKEMIYTGTDPAQRFRIALRDLKINTGTGNSGAIGARFMANNQGGVFNVKIISGDGSGAIGLDLSYVNENGPLLVKNLEVDGFNYGIKCYASQNSQTFEHISLKNQKICGIFNQSQVISIRDLKSTNSVTAVNNANPNGVITIIGAQLNGGSPSSTAIINHAIMYLRNIESDGYGKLVENKAGNYLDISGASIDEWTSHGKQSLFEGYPSSMLNIEIKETPEAAVDSFDQWVKVATPNGVDDTKNIQDAIDSGKSTVYFPRGNYNLNGIVHIRGNVQRIAGLESSVIKGTSGGFVIDEGTAPVVVIERIFGGYVPGYYVTQASSRTVVVKNCCDVAVKKNAGTGDLFIEDLAGSPFEVHGGNVWARQLNVENAGTHVINDSAILWILGMKTERDGVLIETKNGGKTELLGFFCYTTIAPADIMFVNNESSFSAVGSETCWADKGYNYFLKETKGGVTKSLLASQLPLGNGSGHAAPFLVAGGTITVAATKITLLSHSIELMPFQDTALKITFTPINASNKTINWRSTDDTIALIDLYGKITALNYGTAFIIAETEDASLRDSCQITVTDTPNNLIKADIKSAFTIFPNPGSDMLTLTFNESWSSVVIISIYNSLGQLVFSMKRNSPKTESEVLIDIKSLQNGLYLLKAEDGERLASKGLIVNR